jgi:hypothetical protein
MHAPSQPFSVSGVIPSLAMSADLGPPRSECGIGALMPWAGRLWAVTYLSNNKTGSGTGLYEIDADLRMTKRPESRDGTYANRFVHTPSNQLFIGPHVIDADRNVRTVEDLVPVRLTGVMTHLHDPKRFVYVLGMEGEFFELDVHTLEVTQLADLTERLGISKRVHFKAGYTGADRVVVANNTYGPEEFAGDAAEGLLAEWDGVATGDDAWRIIDRNPYVDVTGRGSFGRTMFAIGSDRASAILMVHTAADDTWRRYRLPKASHTFDHMWQTEWPRIRETEHERFLVDCHGMFYELSPWAYGNRIWGVRPIASHLWVMGDFCSYRGMLVLGADNASPAVGENPLTGEPSSGLWFGKTDDLWNFGPRAGWGGPWWKTPVQADEPSDPYLMTGFDRKSLHLSHGADTGVEFRVEVDFLGDGSWHTYDTFSVAAGGYAHHEFPRGFGAHWLRLTVGRNCEATGYLHYG